MFLKEVVGWAKELKAKILSAADYLPYFHQLPVFCKPVFSAESNIFIGIRQLLSEKPKLCAYTEPRVHFSVVKVSIGG